MKLLSLLSILLLLVLNVVFGQQTCSDKSNAVKLLKSLLCGYDRTLRPVRDQKTTVSVTVAIWVKYFDVEEHRNIINMNTWTMWGWKDELLAWDPAANNGIQELRVESDSIWVPDIVMHTVGEVSGVHHRMPSTTCMLQHTGDLMCVPPTSYALVCNPDLTRWPFDTQKCVSEMTSWTHQGKEIEFKIADRGVTLDAYHNNTAWELLSAEAKRNVYPIGLHNNSYQFTEYFFQIRRHSASYTATVVIPAFVLAIMTLFMFFLDPMSSERLMVGCMNVLAHCLYLQYLGMKLPSNGDSVPLIVAFFRDSFLLLGMSLLTTIILRRMLSKETSPPAWISSSVTWVLESRLGQIFILSQLSPQGAATAMAEDGTTLVENKADKPKNNLWAFTAVLLDRVCLIVFSITLFILLLVFVP